MFSATDIFKFAVSGEFDATALQNALDSHIVTQNADCHAGLTCTTKTYGVCAGTADDPQTSYFPNIRKPTCTLPACRHPRKAS